MGMRQCSITSGGDCLQLAGITCCALVLSHHGRQCCREMPHAALADELAELLDMDEREVVERMLGAALPPLVEDRNTPALAALAAKVGSSPEQLMQAHGHAIVAKLLYEGAPSPQCYSVNFRQLHGPVGSFCPVLKVVKRAILGRRHACYCLLVTSRPSRICACGEVLCLIRPSSVAHISSLLVGCRCH